MNIRHTSMAVLFAFLICLFNGCGNNEDSKRRNDTITSSELGSTIQSSWTQLTIDYSGLSFVQEQIDISSKIAPSGLVPFNNGFCYVSNNLKTNESYFGITDSEFNITQEFTLGEATEQSAITCYATGNQFVYCCRGNYDIDAGTNDSFTQYYALSQYSLDGKENWVIKIDDSFGEKEPAEQLFITGLATLPDNGVLVATHHYLYWLNETGNIVATQNTNGSIYTPMNSADGTVYLILNDYEGEICSVNNKDYTVGEAILSYDGNTTVLVGSGGYDFLLNSSVALLGVSLKENTITQLLSWTECGLTITPTSVFCMEEHNWLIAGYNAMSGETELINLTCIPADQIPTKQTVTMLVPIMIDWTAEDTLGMEEFAAISEFNSTNLNYSLEYSTYSSAEELLVRFLSGDVPDLMMFSSSVSQEDTPSEQLLAKKGYFADLETFLASDSEITLDSFIPAVIQTHKASLGGLYTIPTCFNFKILYGRSEYIQDSTPWNIQEFNSLLATMDSEMKVVPYSSDVEFLESLLQVTLDHFINFNDMTCNFETSDFQTLLQICKTYFDSSTPTEDISVEAGTALLDYLPSLGGIGQMAETLKSISSYATVKGFPGVEGSGGTFTVGKSYAICLGSSNPEGAWAYLKTLLSNRYQENCLNPYLPVIQESFDVLIDDYLQDHPDTQTKDFVTFIIELIESTTTRCQLDSPALDIILEEAITYFHDTQSLESTCASIQSRVKLFLGEQS